MKNHRYKVCGYKIPMGDNALILKWLAKKFPIDLVPQNRWQEADFLITDTFDYVYEQFDGVRIMYTGENHPADLRFFDYCLTHDVRENDRCLYFPYWLQVTVFSQDDCRQLITPRTPITADELKEQCRDFLAFVSYNTAAKRRVKMVKSFMKHKHVSCGGALWNNTGGRVKDKIAFQKKHLFSVAYENEASPGYQTEKIVDAFLARSIPVYWGNVHVESIFNPKAFIHERSFRSMDEMVEHVLALSEDYERMAAMLNEPVLNDPNILEESEKKLYAFFEKIFQRGPQAIQRTKWQRVNAYLSHFYGHGLFRTIRRIGRRIRGKETRNGATI